MPVSDVLTAVASAIVIALTYRELNSKIVQTESKDDMYEHMDVAHTS
jgi:hypothetical protein